jgi:predicted SAM-dependent methyltransferase
MRGQVLRYVNLGCGNRWHPAWINIDIAPCGPGVIAHNLSLGIPFLDSSCDVVYHSHLLEHLRPEDALRFMQECYRVLKAGGIMRVATPDLERICRLYLEKLEGAVASDNGSAHDYEWILLEMYDQTVRERRGGMMRQFLEQNPLPNETFIYQRIGEEGREIIRALRSNAVGKLLSTDQSPRSIFFRLGEFRKSRQRLVNWALNSILLCLLGRDGLRALEIGRFRLAGEVHHWMYDRYSLSQLMRAASFQDPITQSATTSQIPQWSSFNLDTLPDGTVIKPDSFFMESVKPAEQ